MEDEENMRILVWAIMSIMIVLAGCAPSVSQKEQQRMDEMSRPYQRSTDYRTALTTLGRVVNKGLDGEIRFQIAPIINKTGGQSIPPDVSDMVISSVNTVAGDFLRLVAYHDPDYIATQTAIGAQIQPLLPNIVIHGAVTEFDEGISLKERGVDIQVYVPYELKEEPAQVLVPDGNGNYTTLEIESDSKQIDTDVGLAFDKTETISRVTIDFHIMDYNTLAYLPRMHVSNTILVCDLEKGRKFGFIIYGSGISVWGKIIERQGIHQAVRNLIDYSVLNLISLYYNVPFWRTLGFASHPKGNATE